MATLRGYTEKDWPHFLQLDLETAIDALGESTEGTQAELENRIALALADRTEKCVLLIDIQHPIVPANEAEAAAVLSLVKELWVDLIRKARERRARLPVFLLIPLAYEPKRWLLGYTARARKTREVIENLVETPELDSNTAVEVLPELEPFTKQDLEDYFRLSCGMPLAEARALAEPMLRYRDNEAIFVGVKEAIKKWKSKNR